MTCYRVRIEQFVSSCIYIHGYNPFYLTIDIIYDISLSQALVNYKQKEWVKGWFFINLWLIPERLPYCTLTCTWEDQPTEFVNITANVSCLPPQTVWD